MSLFFEFYPEADRLSDAARFYYGTNSEGVVLNPDEIPISNLITALRVHAISGQKMQKNKHNTKGGIALQPYIQNHSQAVSTISIYNSKHDETTILQPWYKRLQENLKKNVDWSKLAERVRIFDEFMNGKQRLHYTQLEGIATNLAWMKGGATIYRQRLEQFNREHKGNNPYPRDGRFELLRDFRQRNQDYDTAMFPMNLDNPKFNAPSEDHQYKNLIHAERDQVKGVNILEPVKRMSLPHAEQLFQYTFDQVMDS